MKQVDYLIVGAGLFGATFAHMVKQSGASCLVIDKRDHIAGNCYVEDVGGVEVHKYGPHIFHTKDLRIWRFVNSFASFNSFRYRVKAHNGGEMYSFPINLSTFHDLWGVKTPKEAREALSRRLSNKGNSSTVEGWCLNNIGEELYEKFIKHYTIKQWGIDPKLLPSMIVERLPFRFTYSDYYYEDWEYQGIPNCGYTKMVSNMLNGIPVELRTDYLADRSILDEQAKKVLFTGCVDEFFDYSYGRLPYRSLTFDVRIFPDVDDYQGITTINYTDESVPYTRDVEYKHFKNIVVSGTLVVRELPGSGGEPFYPIPLEKNIKLHKQYLRLSRNYNKYLFGGRLGCYEYLNMDQTISRSLLLARDEGFTKGGI